MEKRNTLLTLILMLAMLVNLISYRPMKAEAENSGITVSAPRNGDRITERYKVKFNVPATLNAEKITLIYDSTDAKEKEVPVEINPAGSYEVLIEGLSEGANYIRIKAVVPAVQTPEATTTANTKAVTTTPATTAPSTTVPVPETREEVVEVAVTVENAATAIMTTEENKGPIATDKNQLKNMLKEKNHQQAQSLGIEPKSDEYISYFIDTLFEEAAKEEVRPDVVFAQIMLETGWLTFYGDVNETQNNFGGIGATGGGVKGNAFDTVRDGIIVNIQHLVAYASDKELNGELLDPRFHLLSDKRGLTPTVEELGFYENVNGAGWAMSPQYGFKIKDMLTELSQYNNAEFQPAPPEKYTVNLFLSYVDINGISTTINQGQAKIGDNIRAAVATNGVVETKLQVMNGTEVIATKDYSQETAFNFTVPAAGKYTVVAEVRPVGSTGEAAAKIEKVFDISTTVVDPSTKPETVPTPGTNSENPQPGEGYTLYNAVNAYSTAAEAQAGADVPKKYEAGAYYVYKVHEGMLNLSKSKGVAGAWINPAQNDASNYNPDSTQPSTTAPGNTAPGDTVPGGETRNYTPGSKVNVTKSIPVYANAQDAKNRANSIKNYEAGEYFVYKTVDGMVNISRQSGVPGGWANPEDLSGGNTGTTPTTTTPSTTKPATTTPSTTKAPSTTTPTTTKAPVTTVPTVTKPQSNTVSLANMAPGTEIKITKSVPVYLSATDAANRKNSVKSYTAGTYYIYKSFNGMVNITKTKGTVGAWVNPSEVVLDGSTSTPGTSVPAETKPGSSTPVSTVPVAGGIYALKVNVNKYATAQDALNNVRPLGTYVPGNYYVYKVNGNAVNISRTPGIPGAWINITGNTSTGTKPVTNVTVPSPGTVATRPGTTTPGTTSPGTVGNISFKVGQRLSVVNSVSKFITATDASNGRNVIGTAAPGTYYVYKTFNGMVNISAKAGAPGFWVNPRNLTLSGGLAQTTPVKTNPAPSTTTPVTKATRPVTTATTAAPVKTVPATLTETKAADNGVYILNHEVNVYGSSTDARNGTNPIKKYPAGTYYIYKEFGGMINISPYPGSVGSWINPSDN